MADKAGRVIFIGNIPYGLTEEQIVHILSSAGPVLSFRLVYNSDTGRPKGFGFAEFADADAAGSAVRNLNGHQIMNRALRVDYSHVGGKDADMVPPEHQQQQQSGAQPASGTLPPLPPGIELPAGISCPDAISKTLSTLAPSQLLDILSQMKGLVMGDPSKAMELLKQAPQLAYAIFQALLLMGLVDTSVLASVVENGGQGAPAPASQAPDTIPARPNTAYQMPSQSYPPPPPQQQQQIPPAASVATPPVYGQIYQPPPAPAPQPQSQSSQEDLLKQVMAMTQQQIDQLGPVERGQIMALRASMGIR